MANLNDHVVDTAAEYPPSARVYDLLVLIERNQRDGNGVPREKVYEYADAISEAGGHPDREGVEEDLGEMETDSETWAEPNAVYALDGDRLAAFPASWYEELGGERDVSRMLEFVLDRVDDPSTAFESGGPGDGMPLETLYDLAGAVGDLNYEETRAAVERLRDEGIVTESADQHPNPTIAFTDERGPDGDDG